MSTSSAPILVPVDFSPSTEHTLEHAIMLASTYQTGIVLMHAIETHFSGFNLADLALHSDSRENAIYQLVETRLKKRAEELNKKGIVAEYRIDYGAVHKTIANTAEEIGAAFIVVGAHGQSGFEEFLIGSNSFRLCATAPCPVITVPKNEDLYTHSYATIVMPIDTSFYTRQKVRLTADLAEKFAAHVHVFGVSVEDDAESMHHVRIITKQVGEYLSNRGIAHTLNEAFGNNITDATMVYAKAVNADLISIMTEQEPSIRSLIMGEFAQQMINRAPIPVLSLRPHEMSNTAEFSM
ncbi:MAG: universal stress protein [Sphingobacteriaceae bacterium]|nr:universal stress protein [Sphingobacteriaceae bacterium]